MRRALGWLLLLLLPAFAWAEAGLPRIVAQKQSVQDAQPGIYAYTLTVSNQGESAVERIFVDESGLAGENLLSGGAFTGLSLIHISHNEHGLNKRGVMTMIHFRMATAEDAGLISHIYASSWRKSYRGHVSYTHLR